MAGPHNCWCSPAHPLWKTDDDIAIRKFFEDHVVIDPEEWRRNNACVNLLLSYIEEQIIKELVDSDIDIKKFVRLGSSREGTKVCHANEFDIAIPFKFSKNVNIEVVVSPKDSLPPGTAKIKIHDHVNDKFIKLDHTDQTCANARYIHGDFFKSALDKALVEIRDKEVTLDEMISKISNPDRAREFRRMLQKKNIDGGNISINVRGRTANQPALTLKMEIKDPSMEANKGNIVHADFVPAFQRSDKCDRKFLVSKWITEEQNKKLKENYLDPALTWRISHSDLELGMFQKKYEPRGHHRRSRCLKSGYMLLKALKEKDVERSEASQFSNVVKSYYLKNMYMYFQHFENTGELKVTSMSQGLALYKSFLDNALDKKCLPQFFTDPDIVKIYFPGEKPPLDSRKVNLFSEKSDEALHQAKLDFEQCLEHFGITGIMTPFIKLNTLYNRDVLGSE